MFKYMRKELKVKSSFFHQVFKSQPRFYSSSNEGYVIQFRHEKRNHVGISEEERSKRTFNVISYDIITKEKRELVVPLENIYSISREKATVEELEGYLKKSEQLLPSPNKKIKAISKIEDLWKITKNIKDGPMKITTASLNMFGNKNPESRIAALEIFSHVEEFYYFKRSKPLQGFVRRLQPSIIQNRCQRVHSILSERIKLLEEKKNEESKAETKETPKELQTVPKELYHIVASLAAFSRHGDLETTKLSENSNLITSHFMKSAGLKFSPDHARRYLERSGIWWNGSDYPYELIKAIEQITKEHQLNKTQPPEESKIEKAVMMGDKEFAYVAYSYQMIDDVPHLHLHIPYIPSQYLDHPSISHYLSTFANPLPSVKGIQYQIFPTSFSKLLAFEDGKLSETVSFSLSVNPKTLEEKIQVTRLFIRPTFFSPNQISKIVESPQNINENQSSYSFEQQIKVLMDIAFQHRDLRMREKSDDLKPSDAERVLCALSDKDHPKTLSSYKISPSELSILLAELLTFTSQKFFQILQTNFLKYQNTLTVASQQFPSSLNLILATQFLTSHFPFLANYLLNPSLEVMTKLEEQLFWIKRNVLFETSLFKILDDEKLFCFHLRDWCRAQARSSGISNFLELVVVCQVTKVTTVDDESHLELMPLLAEHLTFNAKVLFPKQSKEKADALSGDQPNTTIFLSKRDSIQSIFPGMIFNIRFLRIHPEKRVIVASKHDFDRFTTAKKDDFFEDV